MPRTVIAIVVMPGLNLENLHVSVITFTFHPNNSGRLQYHGIRLPVYQVLTKHAGYPYAGLLPAVRPIPPYICADFASPGYFMG